MQSLSRAAGTATWSASVKTRPPLPLNMVRSGDVGRGSGVFTALVEFRVTASRPLRRETACVAEGGIMAIEFEEDGRYNHTSNGAPRHEGREGCGMTTTGSGFIS
jgi:hypothetical protein